MKTIYSAFIALCALTACAPSIVQTNNTTNLTAPAPRLPSMTNSAYAFVGGEVVYYESGGQGSPVILIHGIGGGNSGHQWTKNIAQLSKNHRVYVMDIPGFGRSPATGKQYTQALYTGAIEDFMKNVVAEPADVIASSLPAAYTIDIAARHPEWFKKLVVVSPTGLERLNTGPRPDFYNLLTTTPLGSTLAAVLRGRVGLNYFLDYQVYLDASLSTSEVTDIYEANLAGPNKPWPVFSFISGYLDLDVRQSWAKLQLPTLLIWGSDDINTPVSGLKAFQTIRPNVPAYVLNARAIPNDEQSDRFNALVGEFLAP